MQYSVTELVFEASSPKVLLDFFTKHGEWELSDTSLNVTELNSGNWAGSAVQVIGLIKRPH